MSKSKVDNKFDFINFFERFGVFIFLVILLVFFQSQNGNFLSSRNIFNILTEVSIYGIMAIGMTFVIITTGIDLSVGSILAFCAILAAYVIKDGEFVLVVQDQWGGYSWLIALVICLVVGTFIGFLHGLGITKLKIPPFIVTLGGMTIWRGATLIVNNGSPISGFDAGYRWWGRGDLFGIVPVPVAVLIVVVIIGYIALHKTKWGRFVYSVGGNTEAARLAGVDINKTLISVYTVIGLLAGLSGFILSARLGSAESIAGVSFELRVIASVAIGGTSFLGGYGKVSGTVLGSLIMGVLINGLVLMGISAYWQQVIMGIIIILAVSFDTYAKSRRGAI